MCALDLAWAEFWAEAKRADMPDLARRLGARLKKTTACHWTGPCPLGCAREDGLVVSQEKGFLCRPSGAHGDVVDMVMHIRGGTRKEALATITGRPLPGEDDTQPQTPPLTRRVERPARGSRHGGTAATTTAQALAMWREADDPHHVAPFLYFVSRKLTLDDDLCGHVLRWHEHDRALLALFRNILTDAPQAVSRTFINDDGNKIERRFYGPNGGAAIKLDPDDSVTTGLFIGEGLETCLSAHQFGLRPVWALGSAGAISSLPVLDGVECLTLLQENDANGASQRVCETCAARWHAAGREVIINTSNTGNDLNDALRGAS